LKTQIYIAARVVELNLRESGAGAKFIVFTSILLIILKSLSTITVPKYPSEFHVFVPLGR
jgi:hypothetical protein